MSFKISRIRISCIVLGLFLFSCISQAQFEFEALIDQTFVNSYNHGYRECITIDKDGDNDLDIIVTNYATPAGIFWFENLGEGNFSPSQVFFSDNEVYSHFSKGDIDYDGDFDFCVSGTNDSLAYFENAGSGEFVPHYFPVGLQSSLADILMMDVNGDNFLDIVSDRTPSGSDYYLSIYFNDGNGSFYLGDSISVSGGFENMLSSGDLDQDGDEDLLLSWDENKSTIWYQNDGTGHFNSPTELRNTIGYVYACDIQDYDGDNLLDILYTPTVEGTIFWRKNLGGGQFSAEILIDSISTPVFIKSQDMDMDNDLDIFISSNAGHIHYLENLGLGNFATPTIFELPNFTVCVETSDMDGDEDPDLVVARLNSNVLTWYSNHLLEGCMDPQACNYDPTALQDIGICEIPQPGDGNCDSVVNEDDIANFLNAFGCVGDCGMFDLDGNGIVGANDIILLMALIP